MKYLLFTAVLLTGCTSYYLPMSANSVRATIDQCRELKMNTLIYERPDGSVVDVRCVPKDDDANRRVLIRQKVPLNLLKPFLKDPQ